MRWFSILMLLLSFSAKGQNHLGPYVFKEDLFKKIEADTLPWKNQIWATEFSFIQQYPEVLMHWDKMGYRKPLQQEEDSLLFIQSTTFSAKDYIIEQSKNHPITIINEAHHIARHRSFTRQLLEGLYENGYRYLGLEALWDTLLHQRNFPFIESGYYIQEPEFGILIAEALSIGFTLFGYEASDNKNGAEREKEQAENIQKFISSHPDGKVLIHCGYDHVFENDYPRWGKAMAGRLKELTGLDPLTISQTTFSERYKKEDHHIFLQLLSSDEAVVLLQKDGTLFKAWGEPNQTDIVVIHPTTKYVDGRPEWQIKNKISHTVQIPKELSHQRLLVLAYRNTEHAHRGIPADILEIDEKNASNNLYLLQGKYTIVIQNRDYEIVHQYSIEI